MTELLIIFVLILANGFFAGAEIAIVTVRKTRVEELAKEGLRDAEAVLALRRNTERFLATVQIGITVVGATAAAFGGERVATRLAPKLARVDWIGEHAGGVALAIVVAGISYLSIVVGELVPKSLALRRSESYALGVGRALLTLSWLARPAVWLLGWSANLLLKPFGDRTTFTETRHSAEELRELMEESTQAGALPAEVGEIASRALELPVLKAADVMVPRLDVVMIPGDASPDEVRKIVLEESHSRLPVYEGHIDNVVGYLNVKDLLPAAWDRQLVTLQSVLRQPHFVPESKPAVELLKEMRERHMPFAVVVDEQGGMSGIVTMEDVLEELVGEIFSEHVEDVPQLIQSAPDGTAIVSGKTPVREVNRALGTDLSERGPWTTVAGLYLAMARRMPVEGESVRTPDGVTLEVLEASPRQILTVRLHPPATGAQAKA
jgi:putative hemolysin